VIDFVLFCIIDIVTVTLWVTYLLFKLTYFT